VTQRSANAGNGPRSGCQARIAANQTDSCFLGEVLAFAAGRRLDSPDDALDEGVVAANQVIRGGVVSVLGGLDDLWLGSAGRCAGRDGIHGVACSARRLGFFARWSHADWHGRRHAAERRMSDVRRSALYVLHVGSSQEVDVCHGSVAIQQRLFAIGA
jgi:hypothetical protein